MTTGRSDSGWVSGKTQSHIEFVSLDSDKKLDNIRIKGAPRG